MVDLPRELWDCIAEQIDHSDLLNLALVSRIHVWVCRRLLVREIVLNRDFEDWGQILSLIQRYDLSRSIRHLTIQNFSRIRGSEVARDLFATLAPSGLRSLAIIRTSLHFANSPLESNDPFVVRLLRIPPLLTSIKLSSVLSLEDFAEGGLPVSNLRDIGWDSRFTGSLTPAFFLLLRGSAATVTHLSIIFTDDISHIENYNQLFAFDLPVLIALTLGPGSHSILPDEETPDLSEEQRLIQVNFTRFLIRHPSITILALDCSTNWTDWKFRPSTPSGELSSSYLRFDRRSLPNDILPNLVALTSSPANIVTLAEGRANLLHNITSLTIVANDDDDQEGMLGMFTALGIYASSTVPFPTRELALPGVGDVPERDFEADILSERLAQSASTFTLLDKLIVDSTISLDIDRFPQFMTLRELVCDRRPNRFRKSYVEIIATRCPSLEVVRFEDPKVTYSVTRAANGSILGSTAEAADPRDIEEPDNSDDDDGEGYGDFY